MPTNGMLRVSVALLTPSMVLLPFNPELSSFPHRYMDEAVLIDET
jgi:hypothetical protein